MVPLASRPWPSILLLGPTGSGKTPLGDEIERRGLQGRRCCHFDFGANLRRAASGAAGDCGLSAPELTSVRASLETGALFEDDDMPMILKILDRFIEQRCSLPGSLLVLNGLPRHRRQAEALAGVIAIERIVHLDANAAIIRGRILLDPAGDRARRTDDTLEAVSRRLADFEERTEPLLAFYRERGVPVTSIAVSVGMTAAEMFLAVDRATRTARP